MRATPLPPARALSAPARGAAPRAARLRAAAAAALLALAAAGPAVAQNAPAQPAPQGSPAQATSPAPITTLTDPKQIERMKHLSEELRCLVCQNQSLADSNADLAQDLRLQVEELITRGLSDREIKDYLVQRYGDFVLYKPPVASYTWALWFGPFVLLGIGALAWWQVQRRSRARAATAGSSVGTPTGSGSGRAEGPAPPADAAIARARSLLDD